MGSGENLLGDNIFVQIAWGGGFRGLLCLGFHFILHGDKFFEKIAWGSGFLGLLCLGMSILAPLLLGVLLGVDLLGAVRQGCFHVALISCFRATAIVLCKRP